MAGLTPAAGAAEDDGEPGTGAAKEATVKAKKQVAWRGSTISYENAFTAVSLKKDAEPDYNPAYLNRITFAPRYFVRDDLSLGLNLPLEVELTDADDVDYQGQWFVGDLSFVAAWTPKWLVIPKAQIAVSPSLGVAFPTSLASQARTMILSLTPGVAFSRKLPMVKGSKWMSSITLSYNFRATKYFNEYTTPQFRDPDRITLGSTDPSRSDHYSMSSRNPSYRLFNGLGFAMAIHETLSLSGSFTVINTMLYQHEAYQVPLEVVGWEAVAEETKINHQGALWGVAEIAYSGLDWVELALGVSSYHPQLMPSSTEYYTPFFNRFTQIYFNITLPVDRIVERVRQWVGPGQGAQG